MMLQNQTITQMQVAENLIQDVKKHHIIEISDWVFFCTKAYMVSEQSSDECMEDLSSYDSSKSPYWIYARDGSTPQAINTAEELVSALDKID